MPDSHRIPGSQLPEWQTYQVTAQNVNGELQETGVTTPDGIHYPFQNQERLAWVRDAKEGTRTGIVTLINGDKIPLKMWMKREKDAHGNEAVEAIDPLNSLNRDLLRQLTEECKTGTLFGKHKTLSAEERQEIKKVVAEMEVRLTAAKSDPQWSEFEKVVKEQSGKGHLISLFTFPPSWLVNGGEHQKTVEVDSTGLVRITVPQNIFHIYVWDGYKDTLEHYATTSDEALRGTSTKSLGEALKNASYFLKH